jgi:glycerol-3-phosphate dehydrogenase
VTRDYVLDLDGANDKAPLLSVFGGKITTLPQGALPSTRSKSWCRSSRMRKGDWTAGADLPGGDIPGDDVAAFAAQLAAGPCPALVRCSPAARHAPDGTRAGAILGMAHTMDALGTDFGGGLTQAEVDCLADQEWARSAEDALYRRRQAWPACAAGHGRSCRSLSCGAPFLNVSAISLNQRMVRNWASPDVRCAVSGRKTGVCCAGKACAGV